MSLSYLSFPLHIILSGLDSHYLALSYYYGYLPEKRLYLEYFHIPYLIATASAHAYYALCQSRTLWGRCYGTRVSPLLQGTIRHAGRIV